MNVDLSQAEKIVLCAIPFLKSSWSGSPNLRYKEAHLATGITRSEWDVAVNSLIEKGLLDKRQSLTVNGRSIATRVAIWLLGTQK